MQLNVGRVVLLLLLLSLIRCRVPSTLLSAESVEKALNARAHDPLPDNELELAEWQLGRAKLVSSSGRSGPSAGLQRLTCCVLRIRMISSRGLQSRWQCYLFRASKTTRGANVTYELASALACSDDASALTAVCFARQVRCRVGLLDVISPNSGLVSLEAGNCELSPINFFTRELLSVLCTLHKCLLDRHLCYD